MRTQTFSLIRMKISLKP